MNLKYKPSRVCWDVYRKYVQKVNCKKLYNVWLKWRINVYQLVVTNMWLKSNIIFIQMLTNYFHISNKNMVNIVQRNIKSKKNTTLLQSLDLVPESKQNTQHDW